ncbi:MAG: tetratricopeptide repeat protein [Bryobacteraceae bacterium]|jgi:tetratricopeptide (TPR) repeat protein
MKSVLIPIASVACTWAAADAGALAEANTGLGLAREGKYELAIPHYRAAVKVDPHLSDIYLNLGLAYLKLERFPEAATAFEKAAKADRTRSTSFERCLPRTRIRRPSQALTFLGDAEMHLEAEKAAEEHLRRALSPDANIRLAQLDLGTLLAGRNDYDGAASHFREAIRMDSKKPDAHYRLGRLLRSMGYEQEADAEFAKVEDLAKEEPQAPLIALPGIERKQVP